MLTSNLSSYVNFNICLQKKQSLKERQRMRTENTEKASIMVHTNYNSVGRIYNAIVPAFINLGDLSQGPRRMWPVRKSVFCIDALKATSSGPHHSDANFTQLIIGR